MVRIFFKNFLDDISVFRKQLLSLRVVIFFPYILCEFVLFITVSSFHICDGLINMLIYLQFAFTYSVQRITFCLCLCLNYNRKTISISCILHYLCYTVQFAACADSSASPKRLVHNNSNSNESAFCYESKRYILSCAHGVWYVIFQEQSVPFLLTVTNELTLHPLLVGYQYRNTLHSVDRNPTESS